MHALRSAGVRNVTLPRILQLKARWLAAEQAVDRLRTKRYNSTQAIDLYGTKSQKVGKQNH